ncbi:MAG: hypothetical protein HFI09_02770 [Bacilli bacterium]|nr:hypothetical protein [Bacilli bacterium]
MKIGIDIDDTITETKWEISKQIKKYRHKYKLKRYSDTHQLSDEDFKKFMVEFGEKIYTGMKVKKRAAEVIRKWHEQGHYIILVTARSELDCPNIKEYTKAFLKENYLLHDALIFDSKNKGFDTSELGLDIFIDDRESVLDTFKGPFLIRVLEDKKNYSKYKKARNWKEISDIVQKL